MQDIETRRGSSTQEAAAETTAPSGVSTKLRRPATGSRTLFAGSVVLLIVLLALAPPLVNVNRFKRRIVTSIGASLGRPVHLDRVSLILLPFPGFKLENFVVAEDPAFGAEPVVHANSVQATLRFSSLWRRRVEFSKISLHEPSINLVQSAGGGWNVESILLQAARIPAAPTAQTKAGPDPRFPYIEATGARVNLKSGDEKLPLSLTEADVALWLPGPQQWRIRVKGKPSRTDTSAFDTGTVSLEGTLGHAEEFSLIPIDLYAEWKNVPLGEASRVITGRDKGLRGELKLNLSAHGTASTSRIKATIDLSGARRAEFVPEHPLNISAECEGTADRTFHAFHQISCSSLSPAAGLLAVTADVPDVLHMQSTSFEVGAVALPVPVLLTWLRTASNRVGQELTATGTLMGALNQAEGEWSGKIVLKDASVQGGPIGEVPVTLGGTVVTSESDATTAMPPPRRGRREGSPIPKSADGGFAMSPASLNLGGKDPATLDGQFDAAGYSLHLAGNVLLSRLLALGAAIPQFGDGLGPALPGLDKVNQALPELPVNVDITSKRTWGGGQSWSWTKGLDRRQSG